MSLEINFKQNAKSWPQHISLQDGESLQVFAGEIFQIVNPENVAQLVPQAKDLQIVCHDGSSYILKSFLDTEFSQEPTLELKEGTSITWHDFVQQSDGVDMDDMPDDQYSQSILFAPLHVIALASESQKWGFNKIAPNQGEASEEFKSGPVIDQPQAESQTEGTLDEREDYQAASVETTDAESSAPIDQDPLSVLEQSDEDQGDKDGLAPYTTSTQLDEIEIDIREFIRQLNDGEVSEDLAITAKFQDDSETEIEIDPNDGVLRLPSGTFDGDGQRRLTVTINDKNGETETEITITETKDGGGEAFHLILSHNQVTENIEGALIGKLDTDDSGRGGNYTYKIEKDESGLFEINGNVLKLKDGIGIDYEARPNSYPVIISSTDENGNRIEQTLSVWPEDVNEAATVSSVGIQSFEDLVVTFHPEPFEDSFEDEDSDYLEMIRIDTLPDNGVLLVDGSKVTSGQLIDIEQVEELAFHPDINWNGNTEFTWSGFDGQSWSKESSPVHISVESVNDAPIVQVNIGSESIVTDASFSLELPENAFVDVDAGDSLTYSAELPSWLSIDPSTGKLSGIPGEDAVGEHKVTITATDSEGASASQSFNVSVAHANTAPTLTPIADRSTDEDALFNFDASEHFQDSDAGDTLTYTASTPAGNTLPSWLSFDSETGQFTGTPRNEDVGSFNVKVTASDGSKSVESIFTINVNNTNDAPVVEKSIPNISTSEDGEFSLDVSGNFSDPDLGDKLTFNAIQENGDLLPDWISIDRSTGILSGTPKNGDVGPLDIAVTAFDGKAYTTETFSLTVENTNDGPVLTAKLEDETVLEDEGFSIETKDHFEDIDPNDILTYSATQADGTPLPDWIAIDSETGQITGTPRNENVGDLELKITASDGEQSVDQSFTLTVENTNDAPILVSHIDDAPAVEDTIFSLPTASNFEDQDLGDTLTYSATLEGGDPLPDWLSIDPQTGELSGTPANGDVGSISVLVEASDGEASASDTLTVTVENTNDGPVATATIDDQSVNEDADFSLDTASAFTDEDLGDELTFSAELEGGQPLPDWISIDPSTGKLSGTPENGDVGNLAIIVTASDGEAVTTNAFNLTVDNTNDGPIVATEIVNQESVEDSLFTLDVSSNFADEDLGDTLTYSATLKNGDSLPDWIAFDSESGTFSGTPRNAEVGDLEITVEASDGEADVSESFTLSVQNTNDAPTLTANIADTSATEDASFTLNVSENFGDEDLGDTLTYSATLEGGDPLPDWISIDPESGELSGTPENENVGDLSITVTAKDESGAEAEDTFALTVENTNDGPFVSTNISDQTTDEDTGFSLDVSGNFDDEDLGDTLTFTATLDNGDPLPSWLAFDSETGELSGTPRNDDIGNLNIKISASDGEAEVSQNFTLAVENTNDAPSLTSQITNESIAEDAPFSLDVSPNFGDVDSGDELMFEATLENGDPLPEWLSFDEETGTFSGQPGNDDVGDLSITVTATDGSEIVSDTFSLTVENTNDGPVVSSSIQDQTTAEDSSFFFDASSHFSDEDLGDRLTYSATLENGDPLPEWISIDETTGELSGTPENGDVGKISITVTATDGFGEQASDTFGIQVDNTNDGPTATAISDQTTNEDAAFSLDVSGNFADEDLGDTLAYTATLENGDPLPDWISIDENTGELSGTPENGDVGGISITVTASDGEATASDTFLVTVENTNDGPTATAISDQTTDEDAAFSLDVSGNFSDVDAADSLTYSAILENGDPLPDWLSIDPDTGKLSGTPENEDVGSISITVTATDGSGSTATDTFGIQVENTNDGPVVSSNIADQNTDEDSAFSLDVSGNFSDEDLGDTLTYSATLENGDPLPDWLSIDENTGELSGTPGNGDVGSVSITVTASDGEATVSDTFSVSVENTNDGPTVTAIADQTTDEDSAFSLDISNNFSDEDLGDTLTYSATLENGDPLPDWISIDENTGELSGTPENGDVGSISITVTATDGSGENASDTFGIQVDNTNDGPVVSSSIADQTTDEDSAFSLDVSSNFSDEDLGDTLTYSATLEGGEPLPDWISIGENTGELTGTPENGDVGDISVTVTATDESGSTATDTFGIQVENTNDGPVVSSNITDQTTDEDSAFSLDVSGSFSDEDLSDTLTYSASLEGGEPLPDWLSIDENTGELSGTPENGDVGDISVTVTATDGSGEQASDTFSVTVENTNDGPTVSSSISDQTTDEDAAFSLDVSSNFSEDDLGDTLTYSVELTNESGETIGDGSLPNWLSFDPSTGQFSGTPENGDVGSFCVKVTASDGSESASDIVAITVDNTNDGPVVSSSIADQTTDEDSAFSLDVSGNFSDEDLGDTLTYSATLENGDPLPDWISIDENTGELSGTPENGDVGSISITVTATDESGETASDTFGIQVDNTNDGPVVSSNITDQTTDEDVAFSLDVSGNFSDEDLGDTLTYSATLENGDPLPEWIAIDADTGELSGTPENEDVGSISVTVTATDGSGYTASDTLGIQVENTNDGPTVSTSIGDQTTDEDAAFSLDVSGNFSDEDLGDSLSYSATLENGDPLPDWLSIDENTGELSGIPENGDVGGISITVTATDESGEQASDTFSVAVENTNDGPIVSSSIVDQTTDEDSAFSLDVSGNFNDEDLGDTLTYSATLEGGEPLPDWLSIDETNGELSGTPENGDVGDISVTVTATDESGSTATDTFGIQVENTNDGPVVSSNIADQTTDEDSAFSLDVSGHFSDEDLGDTLTYSATLENGDPLPDWLSIDTDTGELSGMPQNDDVGDIAVTVTASDGEESASDTFTVSVENTNDGPIVSSSISDQTTDEDAAFSLDISGNFTDEDLADTLTYSATLENGDPLPSWLSIDPNTGELSGTPENGDVGSVSITVTASDGEATASDTFSVTVDNTNDGPVVSSSIADQSTDEDSSFALDVSGNFSDEDLGDTLSYSATLENGDPLPDWISIDPDTGELSGTPENGDVGDISVTVTATDGSGSTASDTFTVSVENTNDGPVVSSTIDDQTTDEDAAFSLDISGNFSDEDLGDTLTYSATLENGDPLPSWLSIDENTGALSGTPENGDVRDISITVTATDDSGETASDTFGIQVDNTNDGPVVSSTISDQTTDEDSAFSLDVSGNFSDEDLGDTLTYSATLENGDPLPSWLSIDENTGELSGTPENGDVGDISITVTASDGEATASDTFSVTVENTNDGPTATAISDQTTNEDAAFSLDVSGNFDDVDVGDSLTYSATLENGDPLPDWLSIDENTGELSGTPENGDVGDISVTVTATDESGSTATDTFGIQVENTNDGPVVSSNFADQTTNEDSAFSLDVSSNFSDDDLGDSLTYSAELENGDPLPSWLSIDPDTGELSGTPENGDVGEISISVTATDEAGAETSGTFSINVENTNDGPTVTSATADQSVDEDSAFSLDVSGNFSDEDLGDTLTYSVELTNESGETIGDGSLPAWLSFDPATGQLTGTPENGDVGSFCVQVTASDGSETVSDIVAITVENTNDGPVVSSSIADQTIDEDSSFALDVSGNFNDEDLGDTLTYSATLENGDPLPDWLSIDENTGELSGTPADGDDGTISITVTTSDGESQIEDTFSVTVNDSINGADPDQTINGGNGAQTIVTGSGNDTIDGGSGADTISSGAGDDNILGGSGADNIDAGSGDDVIDGGVGSDVIDAGSGNDTIYATEGQDTIHAGEGNDTFIIDEGKNFGDLFGGDGEDTIQLEGGDINLDFSKVNNDVTNIERLDIDGTGANSLKLSAEDVLDMTDGDNRLFIDGGSDDSVEISDSFVSQGTENVDGVDYTHYYDAGTDSHLYINNDISGLDTF